MFLQSKFLEDENGTKFAPITTPQAVRFADGSNLGDKLETESVGSSDIPVITSSASSLTIDPNKYYSFGTMNSLTITLNSPVDNVMNEYCFEFDSGSTATTLSIPASVVGIDATAIEANKHYEISIKYDASNQNYYGLIQEW